MDLALIVTIVNTTVFVIHLVGFSTPYWVKSGSGNSGLWQICGSGICINLVRDELELTDRFKAVQALECLAFIAFLAADVFAFIRYCVLKDKKVLLLLAAMASFSAGGLGIIGCIVFGTTENLDSSNLHFSFAFCIIASIGAGAAGFLAFIGFRQNNS